jgi:hypothetical protein
VPSARPPREPSATLEDLKLLLWAVCLIEVVVAGLALLTRGYFGPRLALLVGLGLGGLVLLAFALIVAFCFVASWIGELFSDGRRRATRPGDRRPPRRAG